MYKIWKLGAAVLTVGLLTLLLSAEWIRSKRGDFIENVKKHHLGTDFDLTQLDDAPLDLDNELWLKSVIHESQPGTLVCQRKKPKEEKPGSLAVAPLVFKDEEKDGVDDPVVQNRRKVSISQLSPKRAVGCCPAGNPFGLMYRSGSACCVDQVFDVSTHFCCPTNLRLLELNSENLEYCHPISGVHFCRIMDLNMEQKSPMTYSCDNSTGNHPTFCTFSCPIGTVPRLGIENSTCTKNGLWDREPICCQGCGENFQLDLRFLIQTPKNTEDDRIIWAKTFLKSIIYYLPVSLEAVRIGFDVISAQSNNNFTVSDLVSHSNRKDAANTIEALTLKGPGLNIGYPLTQLANHGFLEKTGGRKEVKNLVIPILFEPSDDSIFEGARILKAKAEVIPIVVGSSFTIEDMGVIGSSPEKSYRVNSKEELSSLGLVIHRNICGSECV